MSLETIVLLMKFTARESSRPTPPPSHPATLLAMMLLVTLTEYQFCGVMREAGHFRAVDSLEANAAAATAFRRVAHNQVGIDVQAGPDAIAQPGHAVDIRCSAALDGDTILNGHGHQERGP